MKLFFCPRCHDIVKLRRELRKCECGSSWGRYMGQINATIGGVAIPLGIENGSLAAALGSRPDSGAGVRFDAFVIPRDARSITDEGSGTRPRVRSTPADHLATAPLVDEGRALFRVTAGSSLRPSTEENPCSNH